MEALDHLETSKEAWKKMQYLALSNISQRRPNAGGVRQREANAVLTPRYWNFSKFCSSLGVLNAGSTKLTPSGVSLLQLNAA